MHRRDFLRLSSAAAAYATACPFFFGQISKNLSELSASDFHAARRFLTTSQGRISHLDIGKGPAALFLHGFPLNSFQWRGILPQLAKTHRCIAPDFLGLGYTEVAEGQEVTSQAQVAMLAELLDKLSIADIDIVANDSGGAVAQLFSVRYPHRVKSLLLTNCDTEPDSPPQAVAPVIELGREGRFADEWLAPWVADKPLARSEIGLGGMCYANPQHPGDEAIDIYLAPLVSSEKRKKLTNAYAAALAPNPLAGISAKLKTSSIATRVLWGTGDTIFSQQSPQYFHATVGNSLGYRLVPGAKLFFPEEMPSLIVEFVAGIASLFFVATAFASDHLDTPTVIKDPAADIGDLYAWMSPDGRRLNLVMDIVAHKFSDRLQYVFHIDSGNRFGATSASLIVICTFDVANNVECWTDKAGHVRADHVRGNANVETGIESDAHSFTVFAGLRDDPFFNNVKGTREAYDVAKTALKRGAAMDGAGCPRFDASTSQAILDTWRHTNGGPASNFLAGWKTSALVVSINVDTVARGGKLLAVWGSVHRMPRAGKSKHTGVPAPGEQIERTARPLIKNALVGGPLALEAMSDRRKEAYNRVSRAGWPQFTRDIAATLGLYDSFDGECGNQWLANVHTAPAQRYKPLADLLADDRIWVNSASGVCTQFLAVEFNALHRSDAVSDDCGGRTPNYDANNIFRSLLTLDRMNGVDDGVLHDDQQHSTNTFPFLAKP